MLESREQRLERDKITRESGVVLAPPRLLLLAPLTHIHMPLTFNLGGCAVLAVFRFQLMIFFSAILADVSASRYSVINATNCS